MSSEKKSPFDLAAALSEKKEGRLDVEVCGYNAYMVNRIMSNTKDTVLFANEMNQAHLPDQMQADFYFYGLDKRRRFGKWNKKEEHDRLEMIQEYTGYSRAKSLEVLDILFPHIDDIAKHLEKGGSSGRTRTTGIHGGTDRG